MQLLNYLLSSKFRVWYQVPKYKEKQAAGYYLHTYSLKLVLQHFVKVWRYWRKRIAKY